MDKRIEKIRSSSDGLEIEVLSLVPDQATAIFIISHGMCEHKERYLKFMEFLTKNGFITVIHDHRGHGESIKNDDDLGYFYGPDPSAIVDDVHDVIRSIKSRYKGLPVYLFGHSMGSFISRCVLAEHSDAFSAAIFCGTGASQGLIGRIGQKIARHNAKKNGRMPDKMMDNLAFSSFGKRFKGEGDYAWVTADKDERQKYIDDPLCGFVCSSSFYSDLIELSFRANDKNLATGIKKDIPILLVSGTEDPVGGYGKGIERVRKLYLDSGIRKVEMKLFPNGRHEILNEPEREEVMKTISDFIGKVIGEDDGR